MSGNMKSTWHHCFGYEEQQGNPPYTHKAVKGICSHINFDHILTRQTIISCNQANLIPSSTAFLSSISLFL